MRNTFKRTFSFLIALAIVVSLMPPSAFAITEEDNTGLTIGANSVQIEKSSEEQTVYISLYMLEDAEISNFDVSISITDTNNLGVTFAGGADLSIASMTSGSINLTAGQTTGGISIGDMNAQHHLPDEVFVGTEEVTGYVIAKIPFDVPANTTGEVQVVFNGFVFADFDNASGYSINNESVTATITVTEPEVEKTGYEVYYQLVDNDTDGDSFIEYSYDKDTGKWNNTVTAEVYIVSHDNDVTLQAYDIYVSHNSKLTYVENDLVNGVAYFDEAGNLTHIQAVGANGNTEDPIAIELKKGEAYKLGTITFTIDTANAAHDEQLDLGLVIGPGEDITNIAVAEDKGSYYPADGTTVKGVEINQTWTITWNADNGTEPVTVEVGHNETPVYSGQTPEKEPTAEFAYTFNGWSPAIAPAIQNETYTATYTTATNSYTVTWQNWNGEVLDTDTVEYGATPTYTGEKPIRPEDAQYTYEFEGWTPEISKVTGNVTYTATYTETAKTYTVTFHANGGTSTSGDQIIQEFTYGQEITLIAEMFTAPEGKIFKNWKDDSGVEYVSGAKITVTGNLVLTAQWMDEPNFIVAIDESVKENVFADPLGGAEDDKITLTVMPDAGYAIDTVTIAYTLDGQETTETIIAVNGVYSFKMPAANVTVSATFTPNTDTKYVVEHYLQNLDGNYDIPFKTEELTGTTDSEVTPSLMNEADYVGFTAPATQTVTINGDGSTVVKYQYTRNTNTPYVVKHWTQNSKDATEQNETNYTVKETENLTGVTGAEVTPTVKNYDGYTAPITQTVTIAGDGTTVVNYYYTLGVYEIVLNTDGGTIPEDEQVDSYTYGDEVTLPKPTKPGYDFKGWYTEDGDGPITQIDKDDFGNVTLVAKWEIGFVYEVEEYAYATQDQVMLRIAVTGNTQNYKFGDYKMYYTETEEYKLTVGDEKLAVFVTLISRELVEADGTGKLVLKDGNASLWTESTEPVEIIDRDGDVNGDGVTNIADANIVYQMRTEKGPGYYTDLSPLDRLEADVCSATNNAEHRGSVDDVHWIVNMINGVENSEPTN